MSIGHTYAYEYDGAYATIVSVSVLPPPTTLRCKIELSYRRTLFFAPTCHRRGSNSARSPRHAWKRCMQLRRWEPPAHAAAAIPKCKAQWLKAVQRSEALGNQHQLNPSPPTQRPCCLRSSSDVRCLPRRVSRCSSTTSLCMR